MEFKKSNILKLILPLLLGLILGVSPYMVFALIISTLALQAAAALVGLGFRLHPATILLLMTSVAIGCMYGIYELCDLFAEYSPRIMKWLQKIDERTLKVPLMLAVWEGTGSSMDRGTLGMAARWYTTGAPAIRGAITWYSRISATCYRAYVRYPQSANSYNATQNQTNDELV
jgi:hypothetical protein